MPSLKISFRLFCIALLAATFCTTITYAQTDKQAADQAKYLGKIYAFGNKDSSGGNITYDQVLKNPTIGCVDKDSRIAGFTISFLPKGGEYLGPFKIVGDKLTDKMKSELEKMRSEHPHSTNIFIEDILVRKYDVIYKATSLIYKCTE